MASWTFESHGVDEYKEPRGLVDLSQRPETESLQLQAPNPSGTLFGDEDIHLPTSQDSVVLESTTSYDYSGGGCTDGAWVAQAPQQLTAAYLSPGYFCKLCPGLPYDLPIYPPDISLIESNPACHNSFGNPYPCQSSYGKPESGERGKEHHESSFHSNHKLIPQSIVTRLEGQQSKSTSSPPLSESLLEKWQQLLDQGENTTSDVYLQTKVDELLQDYDNSYSTSIVTPRSVPPPAVESSTSSYLENSATHNSRKRRRLSSSGDSAYASRDCTPSVSSSRSTIGAQVPSEQKKFLPWISRMNLRGVPFARKANLPFSLQNGSGFIPPPPSLRLSTFVPKQEEKVRVDSWVTGQLLDSPNFSCQLPRLQNLTSKQTSTLDRVQGLDQVVETQIEVARDVGKTNAEESFNHDKAEIQDSNANILTNKVPRDLESELTKNVSEAEIITYVDAFISSIPGFDLANIPDDVPESLRKLFDRCIRKSTIPQLLKSDSATDKLVLKTPSCYEQEGQSPTSRTSDSDNQDSEDESGCEGCSHHDDKASGLFYLVEYGPFQSNSGSPCLLYSPESGTSSSSGIGSATTSSNTTPVSQPTGSKQGQPKELTSQNESIPAIESSKSPADIIYNPLPLICWNAANRIPCKQKYAYATQVRRLLDDHYWSKTSSNNHTIPAPCERCHRLFPDTASAEQHKIEKLQVDPPCPILNSEQRHAANWQLNRQGISPARRDEIQSARRNFRRHGTLPSSCPKAFFDEWVNRNAVLHKGRSEKSYSDCQMEVGEWLVVFCTQFPGERIPSNPFLDSFQGTLSCDRIVELSEEAIRSACLRDFLPQLKDDHMVTLLDIIRNAAAQQLIEQLQHRSETQPPSKKRRRNRDLVIGNSTPATATSRLLLSPGHVAVSTFTQQSPGNMVPQPTPFSQEPQALPEPDMFDPPIDATLEQPLPIQLQNAPNNQIDQNNLNILNNLGLYSSMISAEDEQAQLGDWQNFQDDTTMGQFDGNLDYS